MNSIDQLWAAYEEARAAEFAALDRWLSEGTPESESAWQAAYARTTEAMVNAQMAARAWEPETIEDMAARVMEREQPTRKIAGWKELYITKALHLCGDEYLAYVWNNFVGVITRSLDSNTMSETGALNAALYIIAERERVRGLVFGNERPALSLTPLAKIELDASARNGGGAVAWMG